MSEPGRLRWPSIVLALALAAAVASLLAWGTVVIGAGDSAGFERSVRTILRAVDRALASTGWPDGWRIAAWASGAAALVLSVPLVWVAAGERNAPAPDAPRTNEQPVAGDVADPAAVQGGSINGAAIPESEPGASGGWRSSPGTGRSR